MLFLYVFLTIAGDRLYAEQEAVDRWLEPITNYALCVREAARVERSMNANLGHLFIGVKVQCKKIERGHGIH